MSATMSYIMSKGEFSRKYPCITKRLLLKANFHTCFFVSITFISTVRLTFPKNEAYFKHISEPHFCIKVIGAVIVVLI